MQAIKLPHLTPIKFAQYVLHKSDKQAKVSLLFPQIPSLAMLIEAAAQSSAAFRVNDKEDAYLVSLKGVKLLQDATDIELVAEIRDEHRLGDMRYVGFDIYQKETHLANGTLVIAVQ